MKKKVKKHEEDDDAIEVHLSPQELTQNLVTVNGLNANALEKNKAGRITLSQIWNYIKSVLMIPLWGISLGMLYIGGNRSRYDDMERLTTYQQANRNSFSFFMGSILMVIVAVILIIWLFKQTLRGGFVRYYPQDFLQVPQKLLALIDVLVGRVEMFHGTTVRHSDKFPAYLGRRQNTVYFYMIENELFRVTSEGYTQFPDAPQQCRIYYLPMSKVLVNMEVL